MAACCQSSSDNTATPHRHPVNKLVTSDMDFNLAIEKLKGKQYVAQGSQQKSPQNFWPAIPLRRSVSKAVNGGLHNHLGA